MSFRRALYLLDLGQLLVALSRFSPGLVDRPAFEIDLSRKHDSVRQVRIVRNGEQLVAGLALAVHPVPQIFRSRRVDRAERHLRDLGAVLEEYVSVHIPVVGGRCPFIGTKRGKFTRLVEAVRDVVVLFPDVAGHLRADQFLDWLLVDDGVTQPQIDSLNIGGVAHLQLLGDRQFA